MVDPNNYEFLYNKSVILRLLGRNDMAIESYKKFLAEAPIDHRKVPESYYQIASCSLAINKNNFKEIEIYYEKGIEAEK